MIGLFSPAAAPLDSIQTTVPNLSDKHVVTTSRESALELAVDCIHRIRESFGDFAANAFKPGFVSMEDGFASVVRYQERGERAAFVFAGGYGEPLGLLFCGPNTISPEVSHGTAWSVRLWAHTPTEQSSPSWARGDRPMLRQPSRDYQTQLSDVVFPREKVDAH